jgi:hypothetical protein
MAGGYVYCHGRVRFCGLVSLVNHGWQYADYPPLCAIHPQLPHGRMATFQKDSRRSIVRRGSARARPGGAGQEGRSIKEDVSTVGSNDASINDWRRLDILEILGNTLAS